MTVDNTLPFSYVDQLLKQVWSWRAQKFDDAVSIFSALCDPCWSGQAKNMLRHVSKQGPGKNDLNFKVCTQAMQICVASRCEKDL